MSTSTLRSVTSIETDYAWLDDCPDHLLEPVHALPFGTFFDRVQGLAAWRNALLTGSVPPREWPGLPEEVVGPVRRELESLGIIRFCREHPELVDRLLTDVVSAWAAESEAYRSSLAKIRRDLQEEARKKAKKLRRKGNRGPGPELTGILDLVENEATTRAQAAQATRTSKDLSRLWAELVAIWAELTAIFGDLGHATGIGWDLSSAVLRHEGWLEMSRLRKLLEGIPELRELIRTLGALATNRAGPSLTESIFEPTRRLGEVLTEVRSPHAPTETRGIERTGEISRMLPSEASLLTHPTLRKLWHARRAERALLGYRFEGIFHEHHEVETEEQQPSSRPRPERGPFVVCLDTSGSMAGSPELVAKALTLEAARVAHQENRACHLIAFSGPKNLVEHTLDLSPEGIGTLLGFLTASFHGGTDVDRPLLRALDLLEGERWVRADVLLVSDGQFQPSHSIIERVREATSGEASTRFHGVLVGGDDDSVMRQVCGVVHQILDWELDINI